MMVSTTNKIGIPILVVVTVMIIYLTQRHDFSLAITNNLSGIKIISLYISGNKYDNPIKCEPEIMIDYPSIIYCVDQLIDHKNPTLARKFIDIGMYQYPQVYETFVMKKSKTYWIEGRYSDSCQALQEVNYQREMAYLAELAHDKNDFEGLEIYINCIGSPQNARLGLPLHKISELNYILGKHFEEEGNLAEALLAYNNATEWYPTVWADPILAAVRILENNTLQNEALEMVEHYYYEASLPWSKFFLGMKLGSYMEADGNNLSAYCINLSITEAGELSPIHLVSVSHRNSVKSKIASLESMYGFDPQSCK